jgi:arabinofuranosyltransferase
MKFNAQLWQHRNVFLALFLLGIITNRTFLAWTSSGLETAMFNFFITLWFYVCLMIPILSAWWIFAVTFTAVCIYLTRPDGLIFVTATIVMLIVALFKKKQTLNAKNALAAFPLVSILIHLLWRKWTYGEWLPNTYYAKITGMWPESGVRYALSFILEYALWFWLVFGVVIFLLKIIAFLKECAGDQIKSGFKASFSFVFYPTIENFIRAAIITTLIIHLLFYTFIVGGDHFEYRVYSHLIVFIFLSFVWLLNSANFNIKAAIVLFVSFILLSYPVPWTHWSLTHQLSTRRETYIMHIPIANHWPKFTRWYGGMFDEIQAWLINHFVCMRHQEHKIFYLSSTADYPSRNYGMSLSHDNYPTLLVLAAGVPGWVLPRINIIDYWGLNDYVIARNPNPQQIRSMAHERVPPRGYIECLSPNSKVLSSNQVKILKRPRELTAKDISACEKSWAEKVKKQSASNSYENLIFEFR